MWISRIVFVGLVSTHWIGTLGVTSGIMGTMIYLSRKERLGRYGTILNRWLDRATGRKVTIGFVFLSGMILYFFGSIMIGIALAPSYPEIKQQAVEMIRQNNIPTEQQKLIEESIRQVEEQPAQKILAGYLFAFALPLISFPVFSTMISITDSIFNGWLGVISQVTFVQEIEVIGMMIFNRIMKARTVKTF